MTPVSKLVLLFLQLGLFTGTQSQGPGSVWTYSCIEKMCTRTPRAVDPNGVSMEVCKLNCNDEHGSLFPLPTGQVQIGKALTGFYPPNVTISGYEAYPVQVRNLFETAAGIFKGYLTRMKPDNETDPSFQESNVTITLTVSQPSVGIFTLETDESYTLTLALNPDNNKNVMVTISAVTFFGARHGLETLSQLIAYDEDNDVLQIVNNVNITDKPIYRYRGVAMDTSRNFISTTGIKKLIDGLSYNKLNMFHWHITDTNSFPMQVQGKPQFTTYGAYSAKQIYSLADMAELVQYARARGVKIVPEFDEPAHTGFGWQWGPSEGLGNLVLCLNDEPWYSYCVQPPCGQLNIVNDNVYVLLGNIFTSMLSIFDNDLFHMGGDEVNIGCYNSSQEILDWLIVNGTAPDEKGFMGLWGMFQLKAHERLIDSSNMKNMSAVIWTSEMTHKEYVSQYLRKEDYIIQIWTETANSMTPELISDGYRVIFSNYDTLYLDCGFQAWIGTGHNWCSPYHGWQTIYDHNPHGIYANSTNSTAADEALADGRLLGSEVPLWMEQADEQSFESRIFPRASAIAERLWSNPTTGWAEAEFRMVTNRARYVSRGIGADRLQPEFCSMYQNKCYGWGDYVDPNTPTPGPTTGPTTAAPTTTAPTTTTTVTTTGQLKSNGSGSTSRCWEVIISLLWTILLSFAIVL